MPILSAFACLLCIAMSFLCTEGDDRSNVRTLLLKEAYQAKEAYQVMEAYQVKEAYQIQDAHQTQESHHAQKEYEAQESYQAKEPREKESDKSKVSSADFVFWGEIQDVNVSTRELNRNTSAVQVTVCGDTQIIFSSTRGLDEEFNYFNAGDSSVRNQTCLISPSLAYKLFGNADGTGQNIQLQDTEYQVHGMLGREDPVIVVLASANPDSKLDKVSVKLPDGMGTQQGITNFTAQTGIQGDLLSYHLYHQWTRFMAYAVPCLIYLFVCIQMLQTIRKNTFVPAVRTTILFIAAVTGTVIVIWILDVHIQIPREMLPSRWSDFEFWSDLWKRIIQDVSLLLKTEKSEMVLHDYHNFLKTGSCSIAAAILGCISFSNLHIKNSIILWTASAASMILTYLFFTTNIQSSVSLTNNRILWLLMPACFIMNYISYHYVFIASHR